MVKTTTNPKQIAPSPGVTAAIAALTDASILVSDSLLTRAAREVIEDSVGELIIADQQGPGSADASAL